MANGERPVTLTPIRREDRAASDALVSFLQHHFRYFRFPEEDEQPRCTTSLFHYTIP